VQVVADVIRGFSVDPADNEWLMACQVYFLSLGLTLSLSWFFIAPVIRKHMGGFNNQMRRRLSIEMLLITLCAPFKMAHSIFSLLLLMPGNYCQGIAMWVRLMINETFVFCEFLTMLTHSLVTVYHASL